MVPNKDSVFDSSGMYNVQPCDKLKVLVQWIYYGHNQIEFLFYDKQ